MPGAAADPLLGTLFAGRYQLLDRLGEGGMGAVYRARAPSGELVAVKVLAEKLTKDPTWVRRFENEVAAVRRLMHPSTVRLLDSGKSDAGRLFMVMELLTGRSLRDVIDREAPLPPERVLRVLMETCPPLAEAHEKGIFHRDLKPDNLFILPGDKVKVLDFSVAKLREPASAMVTAAGVIFGTPQYMAPEQGRGFPVDARSDVYSLGILAFEMLLGFLPFNARDPMEVLRMQVHMPLPEMPGVPDGMATIVKKCLAKQPGERYQNAGELLTACRALLRQTPRTVPPPLAASPRAETVPAAPTVPAEATAPAQPAAAAEPGPLFWAACIAGGLLVGLAAYWLVVATFG